MEEEVELREGGVVAWLQVSVVVLGAGDGTLAVGEGGEEGGVGGGEGVGDL